MGQRAYFLARVGANPIVYVSANSTSGASPLSRVLKVKFRVLLFCDSYVLMQCGETEA